MNTCTLSLESCSKTLSAKPAQQRLNLCVWEVCKKMGWAGRKNKGNPMLAYFEVIFLYFYKFHASKVRIYSVHDVTAVHVFCCCFFNERPALLPVLCGRLFAWQTIDGLDRARLVKLFLYGRMPLDLSQEEAEVKP